MIRLFSKVSPAVSYEILHHSVLHDINPVCNMYAVYRDVHPPTGVEHAITCNFMAPDEENLVVAGASYLHVYRINRKPSRDSATISDDQGERSTKNNAETTKLESRGRYELQGNVIDLCSFKPTHSACSALLCSFMDAKVSVVDFDQLTHRLRTRALHNFEEHQPAAVRLNTARPVLRVDPEGRCAALHMYASAIAIIPLAGGGRGSGGGGMDEEVGVGAHDMVGDLEDQNLAPYVVWLPELDEKVQNVIDMAFMYGYYEPTLVLLCEPLRTWAGRVAVRQDTACLAALSLNMHQRLHPVIWHAAGLPFDCLRVTALPRPIGGILVFSVNALLYLNQSVPTYGVSLNSVSAVSSNFPLQPQADTVITLDRSVSTLIGPDRMVLSLKGGELYVVSFITDTMNHVKEFKFDRAAASVLTTCIAAFASGEHLFLGSRLGNSLLLTYRATIIEPQLEETNAVGGGGVGGGGEDLTTGQMEPPPAKKKKRPFDQNELDDLEIFGREVQKETGHIMSYTFEVCDSLLNIGPCGYMDIGEPSFLSEEIADTPDPDLELLVASGHGKNGALTVLQRTVRPQVVTTFELPGVSDMWTVLGRRTLLTTEPPDVEDVGRVQPGDGDTTESGEKPDSDGNKADGDGASKKDKSRECEGNGEEKEQQCEVEGSQKPLDEQPSEQENASENITAVPPEAPLDPDSHSYLFLSRDDSTMVLQTGHEIMELDQGGFATHCPTICVANLRAGTPPVEYIIQVCPTAVYLLDGPDRVQRVDMFSGTAAKACVVDPYLAVVASEGDVLLFVLDTADLDAGRAQYPRLREVDVTGAGTDNTEVLVACLYKDTGGIFSTANLASSTNSSTLKPTAASIQNGSLNFNSSSAGAGHNLSSSSVGGLLSTSSTSAGGVDLGDEDDLLYGGSSDDLGMKSPPPVSTPATSVFSDPAGAGLGFGDTAGGGGVNGATVAPLVDPTYWLVLYRSDKQLTIHSLPDMTCRFSAANFCNGPRLLVDSEGSAGPPSTSRGPFAHDAAGDGPAQAEAKTPGTPAASSGPSVSEILLVSLGAAHCRPFLMALIEDELFVYEAFLCRAAGSASGGKGFQPFVGKWKSRLNVRFARLPLNVLMKEKKGRQSKRPKPAGEPQGAAGGSAPQEDLAWKLANSRRFHVFSDLGGYSGVFLAGFYPHWIFLSPHSDLHVHPMPIDGTVTSFTGFHNVNCPHGFLYFNRRSELRIASLPAHLAYDAPWATRKIPLRRTPHFLAYHLESKTYGVVTSLQVHTTEMVKFGQEDKEFETLDRDDRFVYPIVYKFMIQLYSPVSWEVVPNTDFPLDAWEHVTCLKYISVNSDETESGQKGFLIAGTNYTYGEDITSRGRLIIFDIVEVVPEPGQPLTKHKMKVLYNKEQKGPVTAVCTVSGHVLTSIGQKIFLWKLEKEDLIGIAFVDTQVYIHQMMSIKQLILTADVFKSVSLMMYQPESRTLCSIARDPRDRETYTVGFAVDGAQLGLLMTDRRRNLILFEYNHEARESHGGMWLVRRGEIRLPSHVTAPLVRVRCRVTDPSTERRAGSAVERRHVTHLATLDGALAGLLPVPEKQYRRLLMLQNALVAYVDHACGLNPRAFRLYSAWPDIGEAPRGQVLDGNLLWQYLDLPLTERVELAKRLGTSADQVLDDLVEIDRTAVHF